MRAAGTMPGFFTLCAHLAQYRDTVGTCFSVVELCLTLCDPMDCSMPDFLVLPYLPEFAQTQVHWVSDAIRPSHPLLPASPPALNHSQHQGLFQWVGSLHQVVKILELQHQSFPLGLTGLTFLQHRGLSRVFFPVTQFESISSSVLNILYGPTLTYIHDYWKNHSFDYTYLCQQSDVSAF